MFFDIFKNRVICFCKIDPKWSFSTCTLIAYHITDFMRAKRFWFIFKKAFLLIYPQFSKKPISVSLSLYHSHLGHLTVGQDCQPAFICFVPHCLCAA